MISLKQFGRFFFFVMVLGVVQSQLNAAKPKFALFKDETGTMWRIAGGIVPSAHGVNRCMLVPTHPQHSWRWLTIDMYDAQVATVIPQKARLFTAPKSGRQVYINLVDAEDQWAAD